MATLTTKITETLTLNGQKYDSVQTKTIASITQVLKSVVTCNTTESVLLTFADDATGIGTFDRHSVSYLRITNLDDTDYITLAFKDGTASVYAVRVDAGSSFIMPVSNTSNEMPLMFATDDDVTVDAMVQIDTITADAASGTVDVEVFLALNATTS
tara:strand:- start:313 stop:780 length:468 start_codon:yes stop_codon:yes gene_type:complete